MIATTRVDDDTVSVTCVECGSMNYIPMTEGQEEEWLSGALIQRVIPDVDEDIREPLISGTCHSCWKEIFRDDE